MKNNLKSVPNKLTLAIHSTDNSFGFACRNNNDEDSDRIFIKNLKNDLCNNLVIDFNEFLSKENLQKVKKVSVSIGPGNFNASRLIVVLARTISQQIKCPLDSISSFELISKRIAKSNHIYSNNQSFWIYKKLKRKGFIAGQYKVSISEGQIKELTIEEKVVPKIVQELNDKELNFQANYKEEEDLKELLNFANQNSENMKLRSWEKVLPLYPLSPFN